MKRFISILAMTGFMSGVAFAQTPAPAAPPVAASLAPVAPAGDVIDTLKASGQFTIFLRSADAVGLTAFVKSLKDVTVLAPTDTAFRSMPAADIQALMALANRAELQKTVLYHFIPARVPTADFAGAARTAVTLAKLPVEMEGGKPPGVNGVAFVQMDIVTSNGVIHVIDRVLSPNAAPPPVVVPETVAPAAKPN
ncbi:MAG: Nex18 symbiotically induced protein [Alphaproteobacteria bacterium PA2]|nr:MAG: Nex18 symbiotically induced protein [Alphaproteobacteria bacterium PA2]